MVGKQTIVSHDRLLLRGWGMLILLLLVLQVAILIVLLHVTIGHVVVMPRGSVIVHAMLLGLLLLLLL